MKRKKNDRREGKTTDAEQKEEEVEDQKVKEYLFIECA